jgi:hypothetical protein
VVSRYRPDLAVDVTVQIIPVGSALTVYVMSRVCRSVNEEPSVTRYCIVSTFVVSMVGAYTSDRTPPATVYQILDVVLRAVPRQSLRATSKWLSAPGPPVASAAAAGVKATAKLAAVTAMIMTVRTERMARPLGDLDAARLRRRCSRPRG